MRYLKIIYLIITLSFVYSCTSTKEVRYAQPSESLTINEEGLVPYNVEEYRVIIGDVLILNILTTPKGDAAQFYSNLYTTNGNSMPGAVGNIGGNAGTDNALNYFNQLRVDDNGNITVFGIGEIKAEGRTVKAIAADIQERVDENFLQGKAQVRLNMDGITYFILGDVETTGLTGQKKSYTQRLNILEALSKDGGMNRTIDRRFVKIQRKYPEGIKTAVLDLTRQDVMNSKYFWLQNGDMILLQTKAKNMYGFGKEPLQALTTGISLLTTVLTVYLLFSKF